MYKFGGTCQLGKYPNFFINHPKIIFSISLHVSRRSIRSVPCLFVLISRLATPLLPLLFLRLNGLWNRARACAQFESRICGVIGSANIHSAPNDLSRESEEEEEMNIWLVHRLRRCSSRKPHFAAAAAMFQSWCQRMIVAMAERAERDSGAQVMN